MASKPPLGVVMTTTDIHFITHNFGDWDSDTKHMTRNQRAIYLDLRTLYFSTAQKSSGSLTMDFDLLCFKMGCRTDSDCTDLKWLLKDKFKIINKKYRHATWDEQIKNIQFAMRNATEKSNVTSNASNGGSNAPCNESNVTNNAKIYDHTKGYVMTGAERTEKCRMIKRLKNKGIQADKSLTLDEVRTLYNDNFGVKNNEPFATTSNAASNASNAQNHDNNHKPITNNQKSSVVCQNSQTSQNPPNQKTTQATQHTTTGIDKNKSISQWQPPSLDWLNQHLQQANCRQLDKDEFDTVFAKFVNYNLNREAQGKFLMTEQIRLDKLLDWLKREKPKSTMTSSDEQDKQSDESSTGFTNPKKIDPSTMFLVGGFYKPCFESCTPQQCEQILKDYILPGETSLDAYNRINLAGVANCKKHEAASPEFVDAMLNKFSKSFQGRKEAR